MFKEKNYKKEVIYCVKRSIFNVKIVELEERKFTETDQQSLKMAIGDAKKK